MRLLMSIAEMGSGGAETLVTDLAASLVAGGHDVCVASDDGWRAQQLETAGITHLPVPMRVAGRRRLALAGARVARWSLRGRPDLVHAHNVRATLAGRLGTWATGHPPVLTTVHGLAPEDYLPAVRVLGRWSDLVVAVSTSVADDLARWGLPPERIRVVPNAVPVPVLPSRADARRALGLGEGEQVALCVARLVSPKRQDLLVAAWARRGTGTLLLAGDGRERERLDRLVGRLGLRSRVRLLGTRSDVTDLLAACDVAVVPSDREGLSMAALEALAAGVPLVASDVGGLRDLADAARLVEPGEVDALQAGLDAVLDDPAYAARLVGCGHELVRRRFSVESMRADYLRLYGELGAGPGT
ncbi:N-acetylgalactosamine-N,N'-diacetylbacillosaminyl-diphospho-undecaprenol 4-alpha-N-acetylgalactosaminyltransferase [Nocardioides dokdonensis FR1436]|uniref:N-acetylgalactosamine-N, N'-diacetylbacillosaminyl-diphospho-undecaprenol 4-alpha-N-acetylgalactosaminyltransferase n=1 Tax=Nocardioides dokdonensis FR1436 TaxID=1300347 RepID=A0A1A9GRF6_9ACTN|nr:glycosyltransferase [Nocardioides dokdonensis]ANH40213.1 N-acetylgalactosamine-N,N'-diacetylbacillosaminyl-diphospho-undecaprenol 4-alpha-N-acetylgalactosaminyltransferase [Nocardioides dokdonensis FR1436]